MGMGRRIFIYLIVCASFLGQVFADQCPECVDPHNNACKPWGYGKANFYWASQKGYSSDITLTAGPCGEPGESGLAYIFAGMNAHSTQCDGNSGTNPCGGDTINEGTFAIIRVSGDQRAFKHIFPGGLGFTGDLIVGPDGEERWISTSVTQTGCDYQLGLSGPPQMRVKLSAAVAQCQPEFDNSKFGINVTFWQTRSDDPYTYSMLARARGSITVKINKRMECDPINFKPDLRDGSATGWIEEIRRDYNAAGGDTNWKISYASEDYNYDCPSQDAWLGPYAGNPRPGTLVPANETFYRIKFPVYKKDVIGGYGAPAYAGMEDWSVDVTNKRFALNLGEQGTVYYHCAAQSGEGRSLVSSIEHCPKDVTAGNGETKWKFLYDGSDRLQYLYNGISIGDPNNPQTGTEYYAFEWDDNDPNVTYYSRKDTQSNWGLQRQWQLEFDSDDRAVKYQSNCSGGCGGSGEFEHIEYHDTFEDVIVKRFNAAGNSILENTVDQLTYGRYEPAYWIWIANPDFEFPDVAVGYCEEEVVPLGWTIPPGQGEVEDVSICDPNGSQFLRLTGNVTLEQTTFDVVWPETRYDFEASVRSIGGSATISVYSTGDTTNPLMHSTSNTSGEWTTLQMSCLTESSLTGEDHFIITIEGSNVDVDDLWLSAVAFVGNVTKPVITEQKVRDKATGLMVTAAEWDYHENDYTVLEKKYVYGSDYMASKYEYQDGTFTVLKKRIACETFNDDPDNPTGATYTTIYDPNENTDLYATYCRFQ